MRGIATTDVGGLLLVDKPAGITSHDVIDMVRRAIGIRRIGHAGTLDPSATGLLLILVGRATRLLPYVGSEPKEYEARIVFGSETETDDAGGEIIREAPVPAEEKVRRGIAALTGDLKQVPPRYSAKHFEGRRAYRAARGGRPLPLSPQSVRVLEWSDVSYSDGVLRARIVCSGGTYVRALARDLGQLCESAAHLGGLRRTRIGPFSVDDAVSPRDSGAGETTLLPALAAVHGLERVNLNAEHERMAAHGRRIPAEGSASMAALVGTHGDLIAIAERDAGEWKARVVVADHTPDEAG